MKHWRRFALIAVLFAGTSFLLGFFNKYHLPRLEQWLLLEIEKRSTEQLPVRIWPENLHIEFFPPSVVLSNVRLLPQRELAPVMAPAALKEAEIRINWFYLLTGRLRLSYVGARGADFKLVLKDTVPKTKKDLSNFDFKTISEIPVDELSLSDISLWTRLEGPGLALRLSDFNLNLGNRARSLFIQINAPKAEIKFKGANDPMPVHFATRALVEEKKIQLSAFQVKAGKSLLVAAGRVDGGLLPRQWERLDLNARVRLDLTDITKWERILRDPIIPLLDGGIKTEVSVQGSFASPQLRLIGSGADVAIAGHRVGDFETRGSWTNGRVQVDELKVSNSAGTAKISQFSWVPADNEVAKAVVETDKLEIGKLLHNIKIQNVPIFIPITARFDCKGPLLPSPELACAGAAKVRDLLVHTPNKAKKPIVAIDKVEAKGDVKISASSVTYGADLQVGEKSKGESSGVIDFKKGFQISYKGTEVHFSDLKNLVNLKLEGRAQLSGTTDGNSKSAKLKLSADTKGVYLENYFLGDVQSEISYKSGVLQFAKVLGQAGTSRYNGTLSINIPRGEIFIHAVSPYADLADIKEAFARHVNLPFAVSGTGTVNAKGWGPLAFNKMSYELKSAFFRGQVHGESFDQLTFNVTANNGQVRAEKVQASRGPSTLDLTGRVTPEGVIDSVVVGRKLRLEESENISKLGFDITGQVDMTMTIRGQLPRPVLETHGRLSKLVIGDRGAEDSTFKLKINSEQISGGGSFMGDVVTADFAYPLAPNAPFKLFAKADKWNFGSLFSIFSDSIRQRDIQTSLSAVVKLSSEKGGPQKMDGDIEINELSLRRGASSIHNSSTILLNFRNGVLSSRPFLFEGEGGSIRFTIPEISQQSMTATVNGKLDLSLMTLFTPFLSDLQGRLAINTAFTGRPEQPQISGSAFIEQGLVKFREFPHPFSNIRADILFSQQDVVINALKADLGGGQISGDGKIRLLGRNSVPVDVKGQFSGVSLNVPEGYKTNGSGTWSMKGPYLPYILGLNYEIQSGEITSEFSGTGGQGSVTASALLPKFLAEQTDQPVHLDLLVQIKNSLQVRNALVQSQVKGRVRVTGPPAQPRLTGILNPVPGGKVFFRDVGFEVSAGYVEYQDDPPDNPKLYLTAQTVVKENVRDDTNRVTENEYEVNLLIQGKGRNPKITVSSLPALTEREIISLLALGMTPGQLESRRSSQVGGDQLEQIGTSIIGKVTNKELRSRLGVDVQVTQTNAESGSSPKITINKQFSPKLSASAGRTLEKTPESTVKMEYKVNRNLSVIGSWEGKEGASAAGEQEDVTPSIFGLDLEFKVNFK